MTLIHLKIRNEDKIDSDENHHGLTFVAIDVSPFSPWHTNNRTEFGFGNS